jgi:hypothetical protein
MMRSRPADRFGRRWRSEAEDLRISRLFSPTHGAQVTRNILMIAAIFAVAIVYTAIRLS